MRRWPVRPVDVVLDTVPDERRPDVERLLREDAAFRAAVTELQRTRDAVTLVPAAGWEPAPPPPLDLGAALAARPARGAPTRRERLADRLGAFRGGPLVLRPAVAFSAAAALLLGGGVLGAVLSGDVDRPATATVTARGPGPEAGRSVQLTAFGTAGPQRAAVVLPEHAGGEVQLRVAGAPPSKPGEHYELWLLDDADHLTSVGTFRVGADGVARGSFPIGVDALDWKYVDVSVERDDGNPAHSRHSVLRSQSLS